MKHLLAATLVALPLAATAQEAGESPDSEPIPFLEEWAERTEDLMRELMEDIGPEMESLMAEMLPRLRELTEQMGGIINYEMPEILPNGDIIIRRKKDAPELPEDFSPDNDPIDL